MNDTYAAQTHVGRMGFLAALAMLRVHINVPLQVRVEARAFAQGELPARPSRFSSSVKVEYVPLMPSDLARALHSLLLSGKVKEVENHFRKDLDARLEALAESPHVADDLKRDAKALAKKIKETAAYAERPGTTYAAYSLKVKALSRDLKDLLERLEKKVDNKEL